MNTGRDLEQYADLAGSSTVAKLLNIIIKSDDGITRADLSRLTGYSKSTITHHVTRLISSGFVVEKAVGGSAVQRKSHVLKLNNEKGYLLGIDLGATSLHVGLCSLRGKPLVISYNEGINVNDGPEVIMDRIIAITDRLLEEQGELRGRLLGIGMGVPAPVEFSTGRPIAPPIMRGWDDYPIREHLQRVYGCPVFVDNDVNIMAMAENWAGCTRADRDFLFIKLGTGIGCGIFSDGSIYRGAKGCAGDIGHIAVEGSSVPCPCGNTGCLEVLAGGASIGLKAREFALTRQSEYLARCADQGRDIDARTVMEAIAAGDLFCLRYVRQLGGYIGEILAKIMNFFNPSTVVFGGGVANFGDILIEPMRRAVLQRSSALATRNLTICRSSLGEDIGVLGAAILARDELFRPEGFSKFFDLSIDAVGDNTTA